MNFFHLQSDAFIEDENGTELVLATGVKDCLQNVLGSTLLKLISDSSSESTSFIQEWRTISFGRDSPLIKLSLDPGGEIIDWLNELEEQGICWFSCLS